jgi:hypothetical protein
MDFNQNVPLFCNIQTDIVCDLKFSILADGQRWHSQCSIPTASSCRAPAGSKFSLAIHSYWKCERNAAFLFSCSHRGPFQAILWSFWLILLHFPSGNPELIKPSCQPFERPLLTYWSPSLHLIYTGLVSPKMMRWACYLYPTVSTLC